MFKSNFKGKDVDFAIQNAHERYTDEEARSSVIEVLNKGNKGNIVFNYDEKNGIYANISEDKINHNKLKNYNQEEHINWVRNDTKYTIHDNNINKSAITKHKYTYNELDLKIDQEPTSGNDDVPISSDWLYRYINRENPQHADHEILNIVSSSSLVQKSGKYISTDQIKARNTKGIMVTDTDDHGLIVKNGGTIGLNLKSNLIKKHKNDYDRIPITINGKDYYLLLES